MVSRRLLALLLPVALAAPARAQGQPATPRIAPTFSALHVSKDELPQGWRLEDELATVSPQPRSLFEDDIYSQILPKAKKQDSQTIAGPRSKGSILYFSWGEKIPEAAEEFIPSLLFGEKGEKATRMHPEQIVRVGGVMLIVSFPLDSEERKWVIERLRRRFGLRLAHDFGPEKPLLATLAGHYEKETVEEATAGLAFAAEHEKELATVSFAAFLEGELATTAKEWPRAEKAYGRALALDATSDPFDHDGLYWAAKDGHGYALYGQKKYEDAARELREAAKIAADLKRPEDQGHCLYNVACCLALSKRGDEAIATLKESIALQPKGREDAAKDEDFASIATRPEFQALLK